MIGVLDAFGEYGQTIKLSRQLRRNRRDTGVADTGDLGGGGGGIEITDCFQPPAPGAVAALAERLRVADDLAQFILATDAEQAVAHAHKMFRRNEQP